MLEFEKDLDESMLQKEFDEDIEIVVDDVEYLGAGILEVSLVDFLVLEIVDGWFEQVENEFQDELFDDGLARLSQSIHQGVNVDLIVSQINKSCPVSQNKHDCLGCLFQLLILSSILLFIYYILLDCTHLFLYSYTVSGSCRECQ